MYRPATHLHRQMQWGVPAAVLPMLDHVVLVLNHKPAAIFHNVFFLNLIQRFRQDIGTGAVFFYLIF